MDTSNKSKDFEALVSELIARADAALVKEAENYDVVLAESIAALKQALSDDNYKDASRIAYSIKGAAGSLGWPLASTAAGYLRHVLDETHKVDKIDESIAVHVNTLELLYKNQMKDDHPEGIKLIKNLYNLLVKFDITPT